MEARSGVIDLTNNPLDEVSVAAGTVTDLPCEEEDDVALLKLTKKNQALLTKELLSFTNPPPSTPKNVRNTVPSPTLDQAHSRLTSKMAELDMSPIEGPPPGTSPLLVSTGIFAQYKISRVGRGSPSTRYESSHHNCSGSNKQGL
jgi:hypothetical protein